MISVVVLSVVAWASQSRAQSAGETVALTLVNTGACGANGFEARRTDRGPAGQYTPVSDGYVVPNGFHLEVSDMVYEITGVTAPGLPGVAIIWSKDRTTGQQFDGLWHKFAFDAVYSDTPSGGYSPESRLSARFGGTHHVSFLSGLQVSPRARLCVTLQNGRLTNVNLRGRLVAVPGAAGVGPVFNGGATLGTRFN
jgi:hypothetical protein